MSYLFFSADLHLGHGNIIRYCDRPFRDADDMNATLVRNIQSRLAADDTLIHIGDFCCKGAERGVEGLRTKAMDWEKRIDRKIIHIRGNHAIEMATIIIGGKTALMMHAPPAGDDVLPFIDFDFILCGHVHEKWKTKWHNGALCYNVGVDVNKYMPVRADEVIGVVAKEERIFRERT